jgi:hypothetical protein
MLCIGKDLPDNERKKKSKRRNGSVDEKEDAWPEDGKVKEGIIRRRGRHKKSVRKEF